ADSGLAFFAPSALIGVAAALAVGRWPDTRRMAMLVLVWLFVAVASDLDWDWQRSRTAATVAVLAFALQTPTYLHMILAYPAGTIRGRLERTLVTFAYPFSAIWVGLPLL